MHVLSQADQKKVLAVVILQMFMGVLDLLGIVAIGLLGALSVTGLQSKEPGDQVGTALQVLHISNLSFQAQAMVLGFGAVLLLVGRTILSIFFTRRILFFFSHRGALISANLVSRLLSQPLLIVQSRSTQETLYAVTSGVSLITLQVLATSVVMASDLSLLVVMSVGLFVIDPTTAIGTSIVFFFIAYFLYKFMHVRASDLGVQNSELTIASNAKIVEVFSSYRESIVRNRRDYYAREIGKLRFALANVSAEAAFLPYISKYVFETAVILGALLIGTTQFILQDAEHTVATLGVFCRDAYCTSRLALAARLDTDSWKFKRSNAHSRPY